MVSVLSTDVFPQLADLICALGFSQTVECHPVRVAIDGVDGAGKTTLADALVPTIEKHNRPVIRASIDGFHNPRVVRYKRGEGSPEGYYRDSFNYEVLIGDLLIPLGPDGNRKYRKAAFDHQRDKFLNEEWQEAPVDAVLLFDGVFLLRSELVQYWDFSIFVDVDFSISVRRAVQRDISASGRDWEANTRKRHYERRYVPGQQLYLQEARPRELASIIIDNNEYQEPSIIGYRSLI